MKVICRQCGDTFSPAKWKTNCYSRRCDKCYRAYAKAWRERRRQAGLPSSGKSIPWAVRKEKIKLYREKPEVKKMFAAFARKRRKDPAEQVKILARNILNKAIKRKLLIKEPCIVCGEIKVDAHHDDYTKPLDVTWLCRKHHAELHLKIKESNK